MGDHKIMKNYTRLKQKSNDFTPIQLANALGFDEALHMACNMLNNEKWDENLQEYATSLLEEIRTRHPKQWNSTWRHDALLGYAYHITLKYDERYIAYKRAFNNAHSPPPQLLVAMARCCIAPGKPPITEEEAISLIKQAIKTTPYIEGVELLRGLYKSLGNIKEQKYWENILENTKEHGIHLPGLDQIPKEN